MTYLHTASLTKAVAPESKTTWSNDHKSYHLYLNNTLFFFTVQYMPTTTSPLRPAIIIAAGKNERVCEFITVFMSLTARSIEVCGKEQGLVDAPRTRKKEEVRALKITPI